MKALWLNLVKVLLLAILAFIWFGVMIPFLINTPDDLFAGLAAISYPVGIAIVASVAYLMWKKPLVRLKDKIKEEFQ